MSIKRLKILFSIIVLISNFKLHSYSQNCINKFTGITFQTTTFEIFYKSIVTNNNEIVSAGKLFDFNNAGHIAKYSSNGNPLWSYQYNLDYFDFIKGFFFKAVNISDMVNTADGGLIIAGNVEQVLSPYGLPPPVKKWGLLSKLDRFGKVVWTKTFSKAGEMCVPNICITSDGDIIAYLSTDNGPKKAAGDHSYNDVIRVGSDGKIKWSTFLFTYLFDAGGLGVDCKKVLIQASNKNIIIGDVLYKTNAVNGALKEGNLHFFELNYETGKLNWETSYEYPVPANDAAYVPDLINVKELPNGGFSFLSTLYLPGPNTNNLEKKAVHLVTNNRGALENVVTFLPSDNKPATLTDAAFDRKNATRTLLIESSGKKTLFNINDDGQVVWQQGYNDEQGKFPINCFSAGKNGYNIFRSNNNSKNYSLLITDANGVIDCSNENAAIVGMPATLNYGHDSVLTDLNYGFRDAYYENDYPLKRSEEYTLVKNIDCQQTLSCCTDIIDRVNVKEINICEGSSYMLPDSTVIQDSGLYYVTFKTALGCDSVKYYHINLDKNVALLNIGNDTCLTGNTTITLKATEGFEKYYWMNNSLPANASYNVSQPGNYFVSVINACGSKTDSVEILALCDYPVYMPTAFTPNGDGVNDVFRITPDNKNKLLGFSIYNRWGTMVFTTSNPSAGWNGTYKNEPLGTDTFIYWIEMMGLSGKKVTKKGYITLVR